MPKLAHRIAGVLAFLTIAAFFGSTLFVEAFGTAASIAAVKQWIVMPGLLILVPAVIATGGSGFFLSRSRGGRLVEAKKRRMPFIGANGVLVLVPCAIVLERWASAGRFDTAFYAVQALELAAGALNLYLMGLNLRDGMKLSGRLRPARPVQAK